jgi:hypothetical protein
MATIIISIILNLLVGTPSEQNTQDTTSTTTTTDTFTTMGGTGTWTNVDK